MDKDQELLIRKRGVEEVLQLLKDKVLKDEDFQKLGLSFDLSIKDADLLKKCIELDAKKLNELSMTDYSLIVSIHKNNEVNSRMAASNYRIFKSIDDKYLYVFSIIDFLTVLSTFLIFIRFMIYRRKVNIGESRSPRSCY